MPARSAVRALVGLALLAPLLACAAVTESDPTDAPSIQLAGASPGARFDPAEIASARIEGDVLLLQVRYGGGCRQHDFALLHSGTFMESLPPQTRIELAHDAHADPCRALLTTSLRFDLTPLKRAFGHEHGVVILLLRAGGSAGETISVRYEF